MVVEDNRDQTDGEHQAGDDAVPQFERHLVERDLPAEALSLGIAAVEVIRDNRQQGAEKKLKHGSAPSRDRGELRPPRQVGNAVGGPGANDDRARRFDSLPG